MNQDFYCEQVLSGKTKIEIVKETENVLAFMYTKPTRDFHAAVIPKMHVARLTDVEGTSLFQEIFEVIKDIVIEKGLQDTSFKVITNGGTYQSTPHLHFHLVSGNPLDPNNPAQAGELRV